MSKKLGQGAFDVGGVVEEIEARLWELSSTGKWRFDAGQLSEVAVLPADNAVQHSGEGGGWWSVREFAQPHQLLAVVIADRGVGIPHRVNQSVDRTLDDYQAMLLACRPRFSSTGDVHRGYGLTIAVDFTARVSGSVFSLESGMAAYAATGGVGRVLSKGTRPVKGVIARLSVPLSSR